MKFSVLLLGFCAAVSGAPKIVVLLIDGQNNHKWAETSPVIKRLLEDTGVFRVEVATTPPKGGDMSVFKPEFSKYKVVVSNYNGDSWPAETRAAFAKFVGEGGGFVSVHAADNAFRDWPEYNEMIALGGWEGRTEKDGPMAKFRKAVMILDATPGVGGHHGKRHSYQLITRSATHPIMKGMPEKWMHNTDELYDSMRGPAQNMTLLATAFSDRAQGGTGEDEPLLFTVSYGKGRVFHTMLGHDVEAMRCVGFIVTLQRGTEWAAAGKVGQKLPKDLPGAGEVKLR
jgi:type 1 glutamine amidotransferase